MDKLAKSKSYNLLHELRYNCRYIDDIITPNVNNFLKIADEIYPNEISLEQSQNNGLHDTFLDLENKYIFKIFHKVDLFDFEVLSFPFLESNIPKYICYNTFFSQLVRFSTFCSEVFGFAVSILYHKLLKRNYNEYLLEKTFKRFLCHYSDKLLKYDMNFNNLWQVCTQYHPKIPPDTDNSIIALESDSSHIGNNSSPYLPLRSPVPLINLGSTCYLNSILQILFQINKVVPFDLWINHLLSVDKSKCTNILSILTFYKFLYLCKVPSISKSELTDFVHLLKSNNSFFDQKIQRDAHEALILLLDIFNHVCELQINDNDTHYIPQFMDAFFAGIYKN